MIAAELAGDLARLAANWPVPLDGSDDLDGVVLGFLFGLWLIYDGFRKWQQLRLMEDTPTERVRSAAVGRTELTGTAVETEGTVDRPFTDGECLLATYEIEEWRSDDDGGHWNTIDEGVHARRFAIDDGTGQMCVDPDEEGTYEISDRHTTQITVGGSEREPPEIAAFLRQHSSVDAGSSEGVTGLLFDQKRRYTQQVIPPETDLYALGGASPRRRAGESGSNAERLVLSEDEATGEFIVSDLSEDTLVSNYRWRAPVQIVGGLALSSVTLFLILTAIG